MAKMDILLTCCCCVLFAFVAGDDALEDQMETYKSIDEILADANTGIAGMSDDGNLLVQHDMKLTPEQYTNMYRLAAPSDEHRAPNHKVIQPWPRAIMPYEFDNNEFSQEEKDAILETYREIERYTCVKLVPRTASDKNYVFYTDNRRSGGCWSMVGVENTGKQILNLQKVGCRFRGLYIHETLHALGMIHEHTLPTRDQYVDVYIDNVQRSSRYNFDINHVRRTTEYSYHSVMHYSITAFSIDGTVTIYPKDNNKRTAMEIGRAYLKGLYYSDAAALNEMYQCADRCTASDKNKCGPNGHLGNNCQCNCKDGSQDCDSSKRQPRSKCENAFHLSWNCHRWAALGDCQSKSEWMSKNCAKACGTCDQSLQGPVTCWNTLRDDKQCEQLVRDRTCNKNSKWMLAVCAKACNVCDYKPPIKASCDTNTYYNSSKCDEWANDGVACLNNHKYMYLHCAKSCDACASYRSAVPIDKASCPNKESDRDCEKWAKANECNRNKGWMFENCANACNRCPPKPGSCVNKYGNDKLCDYWYKREECSKNPTYMNEWCGKSCRACGGTGITQPTRPTRRTRPTQPTRPTRRTRPTQPTRQTRRTRPTQPTRQTRRTRPTQPTRPPRRTRPTQPTRPPRRTRPTTTSTGTCTNKESDKNCKIWANANYCTTHPKNMATFCAKTCNRCGGTQTTRPTRIRPTTKPTGKCDNVAPNKSCDDWARGDGCERGKGYMHLNCKKSCGLCGR